MQRLNDLSLGGVIPDQLPLAQYVQHHIALVVGFGAMLARLRADDGRDVAVPVFDRSIEIARAGARIVPAATRLVIAEGNYLLLDDPDWTRLRRYFDATVFLRVPEDELTRRLDAHDAGFTANSEALTRSQSERR